MKRPHKFRTKRATDGRWYFVQLGANGEPVTTKPDVCHQVACAARYGRRNDGRLVGRHAALLTVKLGG